MRPSRAPRAPTSRAPWVAGRRLTETPARRTRASSTEPGGRGRGQDSARPAGYGRDSRACRHVSPIAQKYRGSSSCVGRRAWQKGCGNHGPKRLRSARFGPHSTGRVGPVQAPPARPAGRLGAGTRDRRRAARTERLESPKVPRGGFPHGQAATLDWANDNRVTPSPDRRLRPVPDRGAISPVSYTHLTLPTTTLCRSRWSPY